MTAPEEAQLSADFCTYITTKLSSVADLRLPASLVRETPYPDQQAISAHLSQLIQRDPAVFLERYSSLLSSDDLSRFETLRSNYEVDYWLNQAAARSQQPAAADGASAKVARGSLSTTTKNRRLAYMYQLEQQGDYFSETTMREREPLIWHEHIGQYEGHPVPQTGTQQGGALGFADSLLRAHDEAQIRARLEQQLEDEECQVSEHESDSGDEQQEQQPMQVDQARRPAVGGGAAQQQQQQRHGQPQQQQQADMSAEAMQQRRRDFLDEMQSRFLSGMDQQSVDYAVIDANVALDDAWAAQQAQDAEDAYFDAD